MVEYTPCQVKRISIFLVISVKHILSIYKALVKNMEAEDINNGEIYKATNTVTGQTYLGQAKCFVKAKDKYIKHGTHRRWVQHVWEAKNKPNNGCTYLNKAILSYGEDKFIVEMIHKCPVDELNQWEKHYIALFKSNTREGGYNLTSGGDSYTRSEDTLKRLSESTKKAIQEHSSAKRCCYS
jgi:group I intron endonuclease